MNVRRGRIPEHIRTHSDGIARSEKAPPGRHPVRTGLFHRKLWTLPDLFPTTMCS